MTGNQAMLAVIDVLEACSIVYLFVGSYSSNVYGVERSPQDADFVVELAEPSCAGACWAIDRRIATTPAT